MLDDARAARELRRRAAPDPAIGGNVQSRIQLPSSVTNTSLSPPRRTSTSAPRSVRYSSSTRHANCTTSTGNARWLPSCGESFASSTMITSRRLAWATIFSWSRAPPAPLIRLKSGSTSSAPSIVMSTTGCSASVVSGMPTSRASSALAFDVGMPSTFCRSPDATSTPMRRIANSVVLPVPRPITIPELTKSTARSPAACLRSSRSVMAWSRSGRASHQTRRSCGLPPWGPSCRGGTGVRCGGGSGSCRRPAMPLRRRPGARTAGPRR